jgi:hypothetical protein
MLDQKDHFIYSFSERPELREENDRLSENSWPIFLQHGNITHWHWLFEHFPRYQVLICDREGHLISAGHCVPLVWDGKVADLPTTIEGILLRGDWVIREQKKPNTLCAVAAMVSAEKRGQNLSYTLIQKMRSMAKESGFSSLIAPVRPTLKSNYPLIPMEQYVEWKREDHFPFDPWIRVHWRLGAQALGVAHNTLTVEGTLSQWEEWTGMKFPGSGSYIIPGGFQPLKIDHEQNLGCYEDPNFWMVHHV